MQSMLHIGASPETIAAARDAILAIVNAPAGDKVKSAALEAFATVCKVSNVVVQDSTFTSGQATEEAMHVNAEDNTFRGLHIRDEE